MTELYPMNMGGTDGVHFQAWPIKPCPLCRLNGQEAEAEK